jgi:hypothetical protein
MLIKLIITIFILFVSSRVFLKYKKREITIQEFLGWLVFWLLVLGATFWPKFTDLIASKVGVSRGADLLVYLSIIVLFFAVFKIIVKLKKIDRDITKIVREVALDKTNDKDNNKH